MELIVRVIVQVMYQRNKKIYIHIWDLF
jgi:hypothetical protein